MSVSETEKRSLRNRPRRDYKAMSRGEAEAIRDVEHEGEGEIIEEPPAGAFGYSGEAPGDKSVEPGVYLDTGEEGEVSG